MFAAFQPRVPLSLPTGHLCQVMHSPVKHDSAHTCRGEHQQQRARSHSRHARCHRPRPATGPGAATASPVQNDFMDGTLAYPGNPACGAKRMGVVTGKKTEPAVFPPGGGFMVPSATGPSHPGAKSAPTSSFYLCPRSVSPGVQQQPPPLQRFLVPTGTLGGMEAARCSAQNLHPSENGTRMSSEFYLGSAKDGFASARWRSHAAGRRSQRRPQCTVPTGISRTRPGKTGILPRQRQWTRTATQTFKNSSATLIQRLLVALAVPVRTACPHPHLCRWGRLRHQSERIMKCGVIALHR